MRICVNCNAELKDDDLFCKHCGLKVAERLSKEDSISLASELEKRFAERTRIKREISDMEHESLKYRLPSKRPRYSAFRFFWPFLIWSQLAVVGVAIILIIFLFAGAFDNYSSDSIKALVYLLGIPAEGVTMIIGAVVARLKRDRLNMKLEEEEQIIINKQRNIEVRIAELRSILNQCEYNLPGLENRVPAFLRTEQGMRKVRMLLESGEAEDFDHAILICK
ncbi:zinc ribbon protein [Ruminococcaceae bacterium R-25]|nr:zinc ribbon protein [Ruminococcaceae bacterium R-25]SUQ11482.1 zinc-ribbon domain-containing protein [Oscillospiraceae bacterium]